MMNSTQLDLAMFVGSFTPSLDAKRRLVFPASWRSLLGGDNRMFAFPHPDDRCLFLYTASEVMRRVQALREGGTLDPMDQKAIRSFTAGAELLTWDAQGRMRISDALLTHAEVKEQVALVGTLTRIELWGVENFDLALPQESMAAEDAFFGGV